TIEDLTGLSRSDELLLAVAIGFAGAALYIISSAAQPTPYDYFIRLADAFLHGRIALDQAPSWLNELVPATNGSGWYVVYPPMPAILLMPFVAVFGTGLAQQIPSALFGGLALALTWLLMGRFALSLRARSMLTLVFGFGTVFWYVTEVGSAWYISQTVAVLFVMAALLPALAHRAPFLVGLLLGCATIARLPVGLTAPFFLAMLLDLDWPPRLPTDRVRALRTIVGFGIGLAIPLAFYAAYNLARWGTVVDLGYVRIPDIQADQFYQDGLLSLSYIPRNLYAIFLRSWNFVDSPPWLQPSWWGLAVPLTTPLILWLGRARWRDRRVAYAAIGTGLALIPIVTHGNVGVTQFGYRFSLDVQPLLWIILATVFERGVSRWAIVAAAASVAICAYGVIAIGLGFVAY
ncbi:MAG TPA: hypothetical protein VFW92_08925, partial [Candidatus Limnocylindrales bacterium]|nr:hypothetical protein [Candidatus Limnocylindrales bacterium]